MHRVQGSMRCTECSAIMWVVQLAVRIQGVVQFAGRDVRVSSYHNLCAPGFISRSATMFWICRRRIACCATTCQMATDLLGKLSCFTHTGRQPHQRRWEASAGTTAWLYSPILSNTLEPKWLLSQGLPTDSWSFFFWGRAAREEERTRCEHRISLFCFVLAYF